MLLKSSLAGPTACAQVDICCSVNDDEEDEEQDGGNVDGDEVGCKSEYGGGENDGDDDGCNVDEVRDRRDDTAALPCSVQNRYD